MQNKVPLFDKIFRENYQKLVAYLYFFSRDLEISKNISQDAFIILWENLNQINEKAILGYLFTTAKNKLLNHIRREGIQNRFLDHQKIKMTHIYENILETDSLEWIYSKELEIQFHASLEQMDNRIKETFLLSRIQAKKNREIAEMLHISEKTVEYRISAALRILRKDLARFMPYTGKHCKIS